MPNRIVREAILSSLAVCSLDWSSEVFYRRLMSVVDDYGRCEALPILLRSKCYPLQTDKVRVSDITRSMAECQKAGLIALYEVDGKQYLQIEKFGQQQRSASKYPEPLANDINCYQKISVAHLDVSVFEGVSVSSAPPVPDVAAGFEDFWRAYPKRQNKKDALKAWRAAKSKPDLETILAAVEEQKRGEQWSKEGGQFIPYPAKWIRSGGWDDEPLTLHFTPRQQESVL